MIKLILKNKVNLSIFLLSITGVLVSIFLAYLYVDSNGEVGRSGIQETVKTINSFLVGVSVGLVLLLVGMLIKTYGEKSHIDNIITSGIENIIEDWSVDRPSISELKRLFEDSSVVHIAAISFNKTFIGLEWFSGSLSRRLKDKNKDTKIMLLDPNGIELKRRELEFEGRKLKAAIEGSIENIRKASILAGIDLKEYFSLYDFSPSVNFLRFDDTMYIVNFEYGKGGASSALKIKKGGWLYEKYTDHYEKMWIDISGQTGKHRAPID